ncbi:unnamed protein product [Clonostachys chloroleuca]|uniref:Uncharacterized protein n=1 Tax=Clonostachys chloroleuca TaxID=1926264 RepID=A0AA35LV02_9HYPO|nr:unnamed protein product [Clonostachys chloroleuca]
MQLSYVAAFAACISTGFALVVDVSTSPSIKFCKDPYFQGGCTEPSCPVGDCSTDLYCSGNSWETAGNYLDLSIANPDFDGNIESFKCYPLKKEFLKKEG